MYFGYRKSLFGPPMAFKSEEKPRSNTTQIKDDFDYPHYQVRELSYTEAFMTIDALKIRYPYKGEEDEVR